MVHRSQQNSESLQAFRNKLETLWREIHETKNQAKIKELHLQYEQTHRAYERQVLIVGGVEEFESPRAVSRALHNPSFRLPPEHRPDPYVYIDYRDFIIAWIRALKAYQNLNLKQVAEVLEVPLPDLVKTLKHWNPMTSERFRMILSHFEVNPTEWAFLEALHSVSDTESNALRMSALRRLISFAEFRKRHPREYESWRYLSHWYTVAIRELSTLPGFQSNPSWIRERLGSDVSIAEIRQSLNFLENAGFFKTRADGSVESLNKDAECVGGIYRLTLGGFHRQMLEFASDSIHKIPSERRLLLGRTFTFPFNRFGEVRKILEDALTAISALDPGKKTAADEVYHVELTAVPLTHPSEDSLKALGAKR